MRNRKAIFGLVGLVVLASFSAMAFALTTSAADLLTASLERMEAARSGHAVVSFAVDAPEQSGRGTLEVWGQLEVGPQGGPAFRVEVVASDQEALAGMTAVSDGTQFWVYDPAENRVIVGTYDELKAAMAEKHAAGEFDHHGDGHDHAGEAPEMPQTAAEAVALLLEYFDAERAGRTTIGGQNAFVVRLIPIPEQMPDEVRAAGGLFNAWIRMDDSAPLGAEYTGSALGSARVEVTTLELDINIDPAVFTFDVPDDAEVVHFSELEPESLSMSEAAEAVDFTLLAPSDLPEGTVLQETARVRGAIVQRYTLADGGSFSLAQGRGETTPPQEADARSITVRGTAATLFTDTEGSRTLLSWPENGVTIWIGGDLTAEQAVAIAESLQ